MKNPLILFSLLVFTLGKAQVSNDSTLQKPNKYKNSIGLEITGIPLNLYYERQLFSKGNYVLNGLAGVYFPMMLATRFLPGFSLGLNNKWRTNRTLGLFSSIKCDALSLVFPNYTFNPPWKRQYYLSLNVLSANISAGVSLKKGRWEFMLPAPCFMYSLVAYNDGEDEAFDILPSVSVRTRINYRF